MLVDSLKKNPFTLERKIWRRYNTQQISLKGRFLMIKPGNFKPNVRALDDIASLAGGAVNILASLRHQMRNEIKSRIDETIDRLDLVPREDYDSLQARVNELSERLQKLEEKQKTKKPSGKKNND